MSCFCFTIKDHYVEVNVLSKQVEDRVELNGRDVDFMNNINDKYILKRLIEGGW